MRPADHPTDFVFIVNPVAGNGRTRSAWPRLEEELGKARVAFRAVFTSAPGHATELAAEAVAAGAGAVVAVGGDGTLNEVINGLLAASDPPRPLPVPIGILPAGTGGDFARSLGLPRDPLKALRGLLGGPRTRSLDLATVNGRAYCNVAGAGFDAQVAAEVNRRKGRLGGGAVPYVAAVVKVLSSYRNATFRLEVDGESREERALLVAVGNGAVYAGGMRICPRALPDDGRLDVCLAGDLGKLETLRLLGSVFSGRHVNHPKVSYRTGQRVRVEGPSELWVHADGEVVGHLPAEFRVLPGALPVLFPAPAGEVAAAAGEEAG